jgi:hypothetical protein
MLISFQTEGTALKPDAEEWQHLKLRLRLQESHFSVYYLDVDYQT